MSSPEKSLANIPLEVSFVLPCLNEARTVGVCVRKARSFLESHDIAGEVIVADNGSTHGSREIAAAEGAQVVTEAARGYDAALIGGSSAAEGRYVIMGDADNSCDFTAVEPFVVKLREGHQLVMGNRFQGGIDPRAMPLLHKLLGNPVLSAIGRLFFSSTVGDFHCGLRAFAHSPVPGGRRPEREGPRHRRSASPKPRRWRRRASSFQPKDTQEEAREDHLSAEAHQHYGGNHLAHRLL